MFMIDHSAIALLVPLYTSKDRHYHDINHIYYCLTKLDEYVANNSLFNEEIAIIVYAIWFHDAIYSPFPFVNSSNEKESASLFHSFCLDKQLGFKNSHGDNHFQMSVEQAIMATEHHLLKDNHDHYHRTTKIMLDLDLSGFAKPFLSCQDDSEKIFKEYQILNIPLNVMLSNRIKFLEKLLSKKRIFYTDYFYNKYEVIARENIEELVFTSTLALKSL